MACPGKVSAIWVYCKASHASTLAVFLLFPRFDLPKRKSGVPFIFFLSLLVPIPSKALKHV